MLDKNDIALKKLQRYCAYQDRCHQEVRTKLLKLQVYGDDLEQIMAELIRENFLNEQRFAESYVRGKFRMKKWGRVKIKIELKKRKISDYCIRKGMQEIEEEEYLETLQSLILKKRPDVVGKINPKKAIADYLIRKGYESELVWKNLLANSTS